MFVYMIVNSETLKHYIGQHKGDNLQKYLQRKLSAALHQESKGSRLFNAMRKHPKEVWSIHPLLPDLKTREEVDYWEKFYIKLFHSQDPEYGYNICDGGEGFTGPHSPEAIEKMKVAVKASWDSMTEAQRHERGMKGAEKNRGLKRTAEFREKIRQALMGKVIPLEVRAKMSAGQRSAIANGRAGHRLTPEEMERGRKLAHEKSRGVPRPPEVIAKWHSPEAHEKTAAWHRGRPLSAEHAAGIAERKTKWWSEHPDHRFSAERNAKISATLKGIPKSPETIAKIKATKAKQHDEKFLAVAA